MKRILTTVLALALILTLAAIPTCAMVSPDEPMRNGNYAEASETVYFGDGTKGGVITFTYNEDGEMIRSADLDDKGEAYAKWEWTYDSQHRPVSQKFYSYEDSQWKLLQQEDTVYETGKSTRTVMRDLGDGNGMKPDSREIIEYDGKGRTVKTSELYYTDGTFEKNGQIYATEYVSDTETKVTWIELNDGVSSEYQVVTEKYDARGNTISASSVNSTTQKVSVTNEYQYDAHDNETYHKRVLYNSSGTVDYTVERKYEYTYDAKGNVLTMTRSQAEDGGAYVYDKRETCAYDENGNMTRWIEERFNDSKWEVAERLEYTWILLNPPTADTFGETTWFVLLTVSALTLGAVLTFGKKTKKQEA